MPRHPRTGRPLPAPPSPKKYEAEIVAAPPPGAADGKNPFKTPAKPYKSPRARAGLNRAPAGKARYIKLSAAFGILAALLLIKLFDPRGAEYIRRAADTYIGGDKSAVTVEALGRAISEGGSISEVFSNLSDVLGGRWRATPVTGEDGGQDAKDEPEAGGEPYEPVESVEPRIGIYDGAAARMLAAAPAPRALSEDDIAAGAYGFDDTPPVPFGMSVPNDVDYTAYEIPFDYVYPVRGVKSSGFGYRVHPISGETAFHYGTDFAAPAGTDIISFADGTVTARGVSGTYGNYFMVSHDGGLSSFYAHCGKVLVNVGDKVAAGQTVAKVGSTGLSTGPHLHFELHRDGFALDPERYTGA